MSPSAPWRPFWEWTPRPSPSSRTKWGSPAATPLSTLTAIVQAPPSPPGLPGPLGPFGPFNQPAPFPPPRIPPQLTFDHNVKGTKALVWDGAQDSHKFIKWVVAC